MSEEISGLYKVIKKSDSGIQLEELGWVSIIKELQENTLPHIVVGQNVQITANKNEGYKYPLCTVLIPIDDKQTFITQEPKKESTKEYWDRREKGQISGWAISTAVTFTTELAKLNNTKLISKAELLDEVEDNARLFIELSKRLVG